MTKLRTLKLALAFLLCSLTASAQLSLGSLIQAGAQTYQALSISDEELANYIHQYVTQMDASNTLLPLTDPYSVRLISVTKGFTSVDGIPLNFRVYKTSDVNAFACADGSVRVYSGLMDVMTDDELLGVVGHEIGHVANHDTKKQFKQALLNTAFRNVLASGVAGSTVAVLSSSVVGELSSQLLSKSYSRKQESNADKYSYKFLKEHGHDPSGMVCALQKLQQLQNQSSSSSSVVKQLFSSHPNIDKRIKDMRKQMKKDKVAETPVATVAQTMAENQKRMNSTTNK